MNSYEKNRQNNSNSNNTNNNNSNNNNNNNNNSNNNNHNSNLNNYNSDNDYSPERQKNLTLEYGKSIKLLRNGDEYYPGQKIVINSRKYRYFDVFLDDVSNMMNARFGAVRNIHTPQHGHKIKSLDQIEDGKTYVASGISKFKKLNYLEISEGRKPLPARLPALNRQNNLFNNVQSKPLFEKSSNVYLYVYRNGDVLTPPVKVLLYKHTLGSFDAVLNEITTKVQLQNGAVLKLYTMEGEPVNNPQKLESGNCYVAGNKERFKRCEYFPPEEFGISPRLLRKSDLSNLASDSDNALALAHQRVLWRPVNSQPSSFNSSTATSGKSTLSYQGKPYLGWHPSKDEIVTQKSPQKLKNPPFVKTIDLDKDDSGIYKAHKNNKHNALEVPEDENMIIDLPINMQKAIEVTNEEINNKNNKKPKFQQYQPPQNQNNNKNNKKTVVTSKSPSPPPLNLKKSNHYDSNKDRDSSETYGHNQDTYDHDHEQEHQNSQNSNENHMNTYRKESISPIPDQEPQNTDMYEDRNLNNYSNVSEHETAKYSENENVNNNINQSMNKENPRNINNDQAASKIQASFRGYQKRQEHAKANKTKKRINNTQQDLVNNDINN